jgi:hypothetical protein
MRLLGQALGHKRTVVKNSRHVSILNSRLAEREGFEPPIRLPVCRISSAVLSTTQPPLRRRSVKQPLRGYVSNARALNKGGRSARQAGFEPRSQLRAIEIAADQHELVPCLACVRVLIQGESLGRRGGRRSACRFRNEDQVTAEHGKPFNQGAASALFPSCATRLRTTSPPQP